MPMDRRTLLLAPLALGLAGFTEATLPQQWNGGHPVALKPIWDLLASPKVSGDPKSGLLTAAFPDDVRRLDGTVIDVDGFILPLDPGRDAIHFALTRRNAGCPFCPPSQPTEAIEVIMVEPLRITADLITVSGRLKLHPSSDQGMFYQIAGAKLV